MRRPLTVAALAAGLSGCGSDTVPTAPATPAPARVQLAGIWTMTLTRTSVTGGECLEGAYNSTVGTVTPLTMTITQTGASLNATSTAQTTGVSCFWSGTADVDRFALNLSSCQANANQLNQRCTNGAVRDLRIASSGINAVINNVTGAYAGTKADTYNVVVSGTTQQVGTLVVNENVSMTK